MIDAGCDFLSASVLNTERCENTGVFWGDSRVALKQITDGTSKTFMLGERDKFCLAATWIGVRNPLNGSEMWSSVWASGHTWFKLNHPITGAHDTCAESFSSPHPGGGFFAFCDGSVTFIKDDIEHDTLDISGAGGVNRRDCFASPKATSGTPCRTQGPGPRYIGAYQKLSWRNDGLTFNAGDY
jgi:prepilin-type processing-associated H-X9-DG protein